MRRGASSTASTPRGLGSRLRALDLALRRGAARSGSAVTDVALVPSVERAPSLRYEVVGPEGGRHTVRVWGRTRRSPARVVASLGEDASRWPYGTSTTPSGLEEALADVGERERSRLSSGHSGPSSSYASNAAVLAFSEALAASRVVDARRLLALAVEPDHGGAAALLLLALGDVERLGGEVEEWDLRAVLRVLDDLASGVPVEWTARRLEDSS